MKKIARPDSKCPVCGEERNYVNRGLEQHSKCANGHEWCYEGGQKVLWSNRKLSSVLDTIPVTQEAMPGVHYFNTDKPQEIVDAIVEVAKSAGSIDYNRDIVEVVIRCTPSAAVEMTRLVNFIRVNGAPGHSFPIVVDYDSVCNTDGSEYFVDGRDTRHFFFDGDGADFIKEIEIHDPRNLMRDEINSDTNLKQWFDDDLKQTDVEDGWGEILIEHLEPSAIPSCCEDSCAEDIEIALLESPDPDSADGDFATVASNKLNENGVVQGVPDQRDRKMRPDLERNREHKMRQLNQYEPTNVDKDQFSMTSAQVAVGMEQKDFFDIIHYAKRDIANFAWDEIEIDDGVGIVNLGVVSDDASAKAAYEDACNKLNAWKQDNLGEFFIEEIGSTLVLNIKLTEEQYNESVKGINVTSAVVVALTGDSETAFFGQRPPEEVKQMIAAGWQLINSSYLVECGEVSPEDYDWSESIPGNSVQLYKGGVAEEALTAIKEIAENINSIGHGAFAKYVEQAPGFWKNTAYHRFSPAYLYIYVIEYWEEAK